jgi:DNA-directed RNA polymerase specialized sigma24 family protein
MNVKEWVVPMVRRWADQRRSFDRNAWPQSYLGRAREELGGFMQGSGGVNYKEVYWGDGLIVWRALQGMPYEQRQAIETHYLSPKGITAKQKADEVGVSVPKFWTLLDCAYFYLAGRIERIDAQATENKINLVLDKTK